MASGGRRVDFAPLARSYDTLRPADEHWWEAIELLVREGDLAGRRVLDVGCGTGRVLAALVDRWGCDAAGVDASPAMLEVARERLPEEVPLKLGRAEELPFRDASFERVTMTLVMHHVERDRALCEVRRVLEPGGRFAFLTFDPEHFGGYYLTRYFPSFAAVDSARFPTRRALERELEAAGFAPPRFAALHHRTTIGRDEALAKIRGRHISTFQLISDEEYEAGVERAERELPDEVAYDLHSLVVVADRA